jgi:hypothetical protein
MLTSHTLHVTRNRFGRMRILNLAALSFFAACCGRFRINVSLVDLKAVTRLLVATTLPTA